MFRNQYDQDVVTWSPEGRIYQVEYAMEAVKQGSAAVGVRSSDFAVVATLKRSTGSLASYQKKIFKVDEHIGIGIAGLTADARVLCKYMRNECLNHSFVYEAPLPVGRLALQVADKAQQKASSSSRRPYGVGLLIVGHDESGAHLYNICPSGNYYEYKAMSIGARAQSAKTYLERHYESFEPLGLDELVKHAVMALRETTAQDTELTQQNCAVGIVGRNTPFTLLEDDLVAPYLQGLEQSSASAASSADDAKQGDAAMGE